MKQYFELKKEEARLKKEIISKAEQVAGDYNIHLSFYTASIVISSNHFMTTINADGTIKLDSICGGAIPETLEDKIAAVTKLHEAEREHIAIIDAILEAINE